MKKNRLALGFKGAFYGFLFAGGCGAMAQPVACLQKGKMDVTRPDLPLVTCWETIPTENQPFAKLQEACETRLGPWGIETTVLPLCPPKPIGSCFDVKDGQASGDNLAGVDPQQSLIDSALTNTHHYTPQRPDEWKKTAKKCKKSGGNWVGPGSESSLLPF